MNSPYTITFIYKKSIWKRKEIVTDGGNDGMTGKEKQRGIVGMCTYVCV